MTSNFADKGHQLLEIGHDAYGMKEYLAVAHHPTIWKSIAALCLIREGNSNAMYWDRVGRMHYVRDFDIYVCALEEGITLTDVDRCGDCPTTHWGPWLSKKKPFCLGFHNVFS